MLVMPTLQVFCLVVGRRPDKKAVPTKCLKNIPTTTTKTMSI